MKHGALTLCPNCRFDPELNEDKAKAMVLTDHFLSKEDLAGISERLRNGQPVTYPEDVVQEYIKTFEENSGIGRMPTGLKLGGIVIVGIIVALAVWLIMRAT
jgi:hypothetical protein